MLYVLCFNVFLRVNNENKTPTAIPTSIVRDVVHRATNMLYPAKDPKSEEKVDTVQIKSSQVAFSEAFVFNCFMRLYPDVMFNLCAVTHLLRQM